MERLFFAIQWLPVSYELRQYGKIVFRNSTYFTAGLFTNVVLLITLPVSYEYIPTAKMIVNI